MSDPGPVPTPSRSVFARIGVDWWAVAVTGVFVVLAVAGVLPRIPW
ncbi:hypothetical protein [Nocardia sp. alder85J]|nr:hypothetical protein [Nocardia sp. alder85J]MCX4096363.1 hypothetical protein [Nocardia sp. alder85J]